MIYKGVVGSQSYNLDVAESDIDMVIITEDWQSTKFDQDGYDLFKYPPCEFIRRSRVALMKKPSGISLLFPSEFYLDNDLTKWVQANREGMIQAQLPDVYGMYMATTAEYAWYIYDPYYASAEKRKRSRKYVMSSIHFRNMLYNYAEGMTFAEARLAQGETRDFLLAVRKGEVPIKLVLEENAKARERAKSVAGYYAEPRADLSVLDDFKYMVQREVELLKQ